MVWVIGDGVLISNSVRVSETSTTVPVDTEQLL